MLEPASLFQTKTAFAPLAERMRPKTLDELIGHEELIGAHKPLRTLFERDQVPSLILWGPPGSGKTTLAKLIATQTKAVFIELSAVMSGVADIRKIVAEANERSRMFGQRTIFFIDEIHRFNKAQQDALLPYVEKGTVTLIGATTENPSFEIISALLSRCRVFVMQKLSADTLEKILERALRTEYGLKKEETFVPKEVLQELASLADGDARSALNALEIAVQSAKDRRVTLEQVRAALQRSHLLYDKQGEEHYNIISALHKSLRGSDTDASLYWLGRMLEAGEDPLYVARRLVRFASEDIGLADPQALLQAVAAYQATHFIGLPECNVILAQAVVYLAQAPKSNALYVAYGQVAEDIRRLPNEPVPIHLRNAPTKLMKELGYGKEYVYPPSAKGSVIQFYLPEKIKQRKYWNPKP